MGIEELRAALTENPSDTKTFQAEFDALLEGAECDEIQAFIAELADIVGEGSELENLLRIADFRARSKAGDKAPWVQYAIGCAFRDRVHNEDVAEMYFRKIPQDSPITKDLIEFYKGFYVRKNNWRKLEQYLEVIYKEDEKGPSRTLLELANLADEAGNLERSANYWQAVAKEDPDNVQAESRLMDILAEAGKWHTLAELIMARVNRLPDDAVSEKVDLLRSLVPIYRDNMRAETKVTSVYQSILALDPRDEDALESLAGHFESSGRWPDLVKLLRAQTEQETETPRLVALHRRIAAILMERFSNMTEAMKSYESILELAPEDTDAIAALKDIYDKRRDWNNLVRVSLLEADQESDRGERLARIQDLARLASERIAKPETGIELWVRVLDEEPENMEAVDALIPLYEKAKDFENLADILERKEGLVTYAQDKAEVVEKLAVLLGVRISDPTRAAAAWRRLLELDPQHNRARVELRKLYIQSKDMDAIRWFYDNFGTQNEYVRTLEGLARDEEDDGTKIRILMTIAEQYRDVEGEERQLCKILEQVLSVDPAMVAAARMLVPVYKYLSKWESLVETMEMLLLQDEDLKSDDRLVLLLDKARVQEDKLRLLDEAFFTYVQAYQIDWRDPEVHRELERLAQASENWDSYVAVLEQTLELIEDDDFKAHYLVRIASIWWERLHQPQLAVDRFRQALEYQPGNRDILVSLETLFEELQRWNDIVPVIESRLDLEQGQDERAEIQIKLGEILLGRLGEVQRAVEVYHQMLDERPLDLEAYRRLGAVLAAEKRWEELLEMLRRQHLTLGEDQAFVDDLLVDLAELTFGVEEDLEETAFILEKAVNRNLDNVRAVAFMEELLAAEEIRYRMARGLEQAYLHRDDHIRLADALEIQFLSEDAPSPAGLLERLIDIYRTLQDSSREYMSLCRLFDMEPDRSELIGRMEELAGELEDWPRLVGLYVSVFERIGDPGFARALKKATASHYHSMLEDLASAEALYYDLLDEDPTDQVVLSALETISIESENWEALFDIYAREKALASSPSDQIQILFRMATVCEDELADLAKATEAVEEIIAIDPREKSALEKLHDLYEKQEQWELLLGVLAQLGDIESEIQPLVELKLRAALVLEERLEDVDRMTEMLSDALNLDPFCSDAVDILERNIDSEASWKILPLLDAYYRRKENWHRVIELLEKKQEVDEEPETRKAIQVEIAELWEYQVEDPDSAFDSYRIALSMDSGDRMVLAQLQRLAAAQDRCRELANGLISELEGMDDPVDQEWMARTIARWARAQLDDRELAVKYFRQVLEMSVGDVESLDNLASIFRETEAHLELAEVLRMRIDGESDPELQKELLTELGGIYQDWLEMPENAVDVFTEILDINPTESLALANLDGLLTGLERWERLVEILEQKSNLAQEPEIRRLEMIRRAEILDEKLAKLDDAEDVYRTLLGMDHSDLDVLHKLQDLYERREDWMAAIEVFQAELELLVGEERVPVLFKLGSIWVDWLDTPVEAVPLYRELFELIPGSEEGIIAVEKIILEKEDKLAAFELLGPILEDQGEWERLLVNMDALLASTEEPEERVRLALRMAEIARLSLEEPMRAFYLLVQALEVAADRKDVAELLEEVAGETGLEQDLVDVLERVAESEEDPMVVLALRKRKARLLKDAVADFEKAIAEYSRLRTDFPEDPESLNSLDQLYSVLEQWDDLESVLVDRMERASSVDDKVELGFRLCLLLEENLGRLLDSCQVMKDLYYLVPTRIEIIDQLQRFFDGGLRDEETLGILENHYRGEESWAAVARVLEGRLDVASQPEDRLDICRQLAGIFLEKIEDFGRALHWTGEVLVLDPEDDGALSRLKDLGGLTEDMESVAGFIERAAAQCEMDDVHIRLDLEAGAIVHRDLGDPERAELFYLDALERDEEQGDALAALDEIYGAQERFGEQEQILARRASIAPYPDEQVALLMRLAAIREERLDNVEGAIKAWQEVLEVDEQHRSALDNLARVFADLERWSDLIPILQMTADFSRDEDERLSLYRTIAVLFEENLGQPGKAIEKWEDVLSFASEDMVALDNLARLYEELSQWGEMVETCRRAALVQDIDDERRLGLWRKIAIVAEGPLEEPQTAEEFWVKVLDLMGEDEDAQVSLRILYRTNENFPALALLLEMMALQERSDGEKVELWSELARLRVEDYPDPVEAIKAWTQVVALDQANLEALNSLIELYQESGQWAECIQILRVKLEQVEDGEKIAILQSIGEILEEYLQDWDGAIQAREEILAMDPENLAHFKSLEELLESQARWAGLADLLTRKSEVLPDEERLDTYRNIAVIYEERLEEMEASFIFYQKALEVVPVDPQALEGIERVSMAAELFSELRDVWARAFDALEDPQEKLEIAQKLALLVRDRLARQEEAVQWFRAILELDEESEDAVKALVELYESLEMWRDLADALALWARLTTDFSLQTTIWLRLGECLRSKLEEYEDAVKAYREVLDMDPSAEAAIQALEELYGQLERWEDLIEVLGMRASIHPEQETDIKLLRGLLYEERLSSPEKAADEYEDVLGFEPQNHDAIERLKRIYSDAGNWSRLADTLERTLVMTSDRDERIELLRHLALLQEEALDDKSAAADFYQQILDMDPAALDVVESLQKLYREEERWEDLVSVMRRHIDLVDSLGDKIRLLTDMGEVYSLELVDMDSAVAAHLEILDLDPAHLDTIDMLLGLYMEQGEWDRFQEIMDRKIRVTPDKDEMLKLMVHKGIVYQEEMLNPERAREQYQLTLEKEPTCDEALDRLLVIYEEDQDWDRAMKALTAYVKASQVEVDQARALVRMANLSNQRLGLREQSVRMYEMALERVPDFEPAISPLVDIYISMESWPKAMALLQILMGKLKAETDPARRVSVLYKLGQASMAMGDDEQALLYLEEAQSLAPNHRPTLEILARLNLKQEKYQSAEVAFRNLLKVGGEDLSDNEKLSIYRALGEVEMKLGKPRLAEEYLAHVIELQPNDHECLEDLAKLMEIHGDWEGVIRYREKLLELVMDGLERLTIQLAIGDIYLDKMNRTASAVDSYRKALDIDPNSRTALVKLLEIHIQGQDFREAIEVLQRLLEVEDESRKKSYYTFTIATILRDHLRQPSEAVEYYEKTLDLDTEKLEAFQALDEILTRAKDWSRLETTYLKMIGRVRNRGNENLNFTLYRNLGEIYRTRLEKLDHAISSFELAAKIKPGDMKVQEILEQLYVRNGDVEKAIQANRIMVLNDPERFQCYRAMGKLYKQLGRNDEAWNCISVLALLRRANPEEMALYREHRSPALPEASRSLDSELWARYLFSSDEDRRLGEIFQILYGVVGDRMGVRELKDLGLKRKNEINIKEKTLFANVFQSVSQTLGIPAPKVYLSEKSFGIQIERTNPPILVIGREMLEQKTERQLAFILGKYLTYFHPMHIFAGAYGSAALKVLYAAAVKFVHPEAQIEARQEEVESIRKELARGISSQMANQLASAVEHFHVEGKQPSIRTWLAGVEMTANHAGLLVSSDLENAARTLSQESIAFSKLPPKDKVKDLVVYAVSDEYFEVRRILGLQL